MKFWELTSICRDEPDLLAKVLRGYSDQKYANWLDNMPNIVLQQQREKLDAVVPHELCEAALKPHKGKLYKNGPHVRKNRLNPSDTEVSYFEVFRLFGAQFLEEVLEKGSAKR
ncbi:hypothetical protein [uncultured Sulfitobacter sp.]|jgi:hypothetical protein|uniref:hypothetical protein n=1 Tax=Sulfitobacter sp. SH22 TaxID=3421172 RepID=UPI0025ED2095|nr:hypothetical protein [uncultured Sulfitobacter sp.]